MNYRHTLYTILFFVFVLGTISSFGQAARTFSNSWINYDQPYLKVLVNARGIHKLPFSSLPNTFPVSQPAKLQMWHRGKQVAISVANNEITFYGVPNDGGRDSLLYRPYNSRLNPYFSLYSDESAYFLTVSDTKSLRAEVINKPVDSRVAATTTHTAREVTLFKTTYSRSTAGAIHPTIIHSYFEEGASTTGPVIEKNILSTYNIQLTNAVDPNVNKPKIKLLLHGRSNNARNVEVLFGKTAQTLRSVGKISINNFQASEYEFDLQSGDLNETNKGILALRSASTEELERFSLAYYSVSYLQTLSAQSRKTYEFGLGETNAAISRLNLSGLASGMTAYDITDTLKIVSGNLSNLMVPRKAGKPLKLLVSNEAVSIPASRVSTVDFKPYDPAKFNFIIVTSENLLSSSQTYAAYRNSVAGGGYKVLVANIKDLYNQFNYGEPSPLGIRGFMDFVLSDGNKNRYLFLVGRSVSYVERIIRELPNEVPTIGYPGSDILLVSGLAGASVDNAAIPVGRLAAITNEQVLTYLEKVKQFEHANVGQIGWKKQILHLNGGKSQSEITQLKNLLERHRTTVENGVVGGKVTAFVKQQAMAEAERVNIAPQLNDGVGMLTYFGHGGVDVTDLDIGYATDVDRGYNNAGKYPLLYFNGCSVGNVFAGRTGITPTPRNNRIPLSLDWMIAPNKGAIAVIANSFEGFVTPLSNYLNSLYASIFLDEKTSNQSIGKIQLAVNDRVLKSGAGDYDIANVHQSLLQADPSLKLVSVANPDYALDADEAIFIRSESAGKTIGNSTTITTGVLLKNLGKYIKDQQVPVELKYQFKDGTEQRISKMVAAIPHTDTLLFDSNKQKELAAITVRIDPDSTISEISRKNNYSELIIEWDRAKDQPFYPSEPLKDITPPLMNVTIDNRAVKNGGYVSSNPLVEIKLEDDRLLLADSSLVDIYFKPCGDNTCDFVRLSHSQGIEMTEISDRVLSFKYQFTELAPGDYELLVNGRDVSGNTSTIAYRIAFSVMESAQRDLLVASPNPASEYVRFALENFGEKVFDRFVWKIFNSKGAVIDEGTHQSEKKGVKEWYWVPKMNIASGVYIYQIKLSGQGAEEKTITGRVALVR